MVAFYVLVASLLQAGSTVTFMNLSLLTSDFFSVLVGVGLLHCRPGPAYGLAFGLTITGLLMYHCAVRHEEAHTDCWELRRAAASAGREGVQGLAQPLVADVRTRSMEARQDQETA